MKTGEPDILTTTVSEERRNGGASSVQDLLGLAHVVQKRVEAAYRRTDLFERRRRLMDDWAVYLARERRESEADPVR